VQLNHVAKALQEFSGNDVTGTKVYNRLRKWRQRWMSVSKRRELSGALWDEDNCMITCHIQFFCQTKYSSYAWPKINCSTHTAKSAHR
jgi:hypothetical protein